MATMQCLVLASVALFGVPAMAADLLDFDPSSIACQVEIATICPNATVTPGNNRLLHCLKSGITKARKGGEKSPPVSAACKSALMKYRVDVARKPMTRDVNLASACNSAIGQFCQKENASLAFTRGLLVKSCLIRNKAKIDQECKEEILGRQIAAAKNIQLDPVLHDACDADAKTHCPSVKAGDAQLRSCLKHKYKEQKLSQNCSDHLFASLKEASTDVRLNYKLNRQCSADIKKFCKDELPGNARIITCLQSNKHKIDMSSACKKEIEVHQELHVKDFRLDARINKLCKLDIEETCQSPDVHFNFGFDPFDAELGSKEGLVLQCLKLHIADLKSEPCRKQVHRLIKTTVGNIKLSAPLLNACKADADSLCGEQPEDDTSTKAILFCLNDKKENVTEKCKVQLFKQEVIKSASVDFSVSLRSDCATEINSLCKDIPKQGGVIKCLQDKLSNADMSEVCKKSVKKSQQKQASDYRLNPILRKSCTDDVSEFCEHITAWGPDAGKASYEGQVISCLKDNLKQLANEACKNEITRTIKAAAEDVRNNPMMLKQCKKEIASLCPAIKPGRAKVLECLSNNKEQLGEACQEEVHKHDVHASENIVFNFPVSTSCASEVKQFCSDIKPGGAAQLTCLRSKVRMPGFSTKCSDSLVKTVAKGLKDFRLDAKLTSQCKNDIGKFCGEAPAGKGAVVKCIVEHFDDLEGSCKRAAGLAVRGAFRARRSEDSNSLVKDCDEDTTSLCPQVSTSNRMRGFMKTEGHMTCLVKASEKIKNSHCRKLVEMTQGKEQQGALALAADSKKMMDAILKMTNAAGKKSETPVTSSPREAAPSGIVLTGPIAFAAVVALVATLLASIILVWRHFERRSKGYTQFVPKTG